LIEGTVYPTWVPYLGAGIPLFQFYGPLNFLSALPGLLAGLSPATAFEVVLFQGHLIAALSTLAGARILGVGWRGALIAAVAAAFAPWRLAVFDYRGALGEANAFVAMPLVAAATLRLAVERVRAVRSVLALAAAVLVLTHLISLLTLVVLLAVALLVRETTGPRPERSLGRRTLDIALPWAMAIALTAGWWLPALSQLSHTNLEARTVESEYFDYAGHGIDPAAAIERRAWDELRWSLTRERRSEGFEGEQMPFYVGTVLLVVGLTAPIWSRDRRTLGPALGALAGLILAAHPVSDWTSGLPFLERIQFPWRFLSPVTVLLCLAVGTGADSLIRRGLGRAGSVFLATLACLLVWDAAPYTGAADKIPRYEGVVHWVARNPEWTVWDGGLEPVSLDWSGERGVVRVIDLALPPSDYRTSLDSLFPYYPECLTPEIHQRFWGVTDLREVGEAGVKYAFADFRRSPLRAPARPYATVESPGQALVAVPMADLSRKPGRIELRVRVGEPDSRLVVLEQFFPGWIARVNDGAPVTPGNRRGFLSVELPEGEHRLSFIYRPGGPFRLVGYGISLTAVLLLFAGATARFAARARRGT
jgi:hypothetical protein